MENLEYFYKRIPNRSNLAASKLIPYFVYFLQDEKESIKALDIIECFNSLSLSPYSNIPAYLSKNSSGKNAIFIKGKCGYKLHRYAKEKIANVLQDIIEVPITENLISLSIFDNTPYYIIANAKQMCQCYDSGLYDATLVLTDEFFSINYLDGKNFELNEILPGDTYTKKIPKVVCRPRDFMVI